MKFVIENIEKFVLYFIIAAYAVFVLSLSAASFTIPKEILLVVGASLLAILWVAKMAASEKFSFFVGRLNLKLSPIL